MTAPAPITCHATTRAGAPCRGRDGLSADGLCALHDPARAAVVAAKRKTGTKNSKSFAREGDLPGALETADDCARWLRWITIQTVTGELDPVAAREATKPIIALQRMIQQREGADRRLKDLERRLRAAASGTQRP